MSASGFLRRRVQLSTGGLLVIELAMLGIGALGAAGAWLLWHDSAFVGLPVSDAEVTAALDPPSSYETGVRPILDAKCVHCHGEKKQKGGLSLATRETILAGGKHGPALDLAAPAKSRMLARIALETDDDDHMPPSDEEQLTPQELELLRAWIESGAPFGAAAGDAAAGGAGADLAEGPRAEPAAARPGAEATEPPNSPVPPIPPGSPIPQGFTGPPPDPAALAALRAALVHVQPVSEGSPLLWIDFAAAAKTVDDARARQLLAPLADHVGDLSLARTAAGDATLELLAGFPALARLDVRGTAIEGRGLAALAGHAKLAELVLSQNSLGDAAVEALAAMPALARVHLWRSGISAEALARLRAARPGLLVLDGAASPSPVLEAETQVTFTKAEPPAAPDASDASGAPGAPGAATPAAALVPVNAKCPVSGAPVKPQFAIVHEGRVIGFCCPECPRQFWADPAKFAGSLE